MNCRARSEVICPASFALAYENMIYKRGVAKSSNQMIERQLFCQPAGSLSVLLNYLDFQVVEVYLFNKTVLIKSCFVVFFKIFNGGIKPDGIAKIHLVADFLQSFKNLMCSCIFSGVFHDSVPKKAVIFLDFSPQTKHNNTSISKLPQTAQVVVF